MSNSLIQRAPIIFLSITRAMVGSAIKRILGGKDGGGRGATDATGPKQGSEAQLIANDDVSVDQIIFIRWNCDVERLVEKIFKKIFVPAIDRGPKASDCF